MSYDKQTWQTGEVITAQKLNHIEGGIEEADNILFIEEGTNTVLNKTFKEIQDAFLANKLIIIRVLETSDMPQGFLNNNIVLSVTEPGASGTRQVVALRPSFQYGASNPEFSPRFYYASSDDAYPSWDA